MLGPPFGRPLHALGYVSIIFPCVSWPQGRTQIQDEHALSQRGFLSYATVGSLDIDWDTVSISVSKLNLLWTHIHLGKMGGEFRFVGDNSTSFLKRRSTTGIETQPQENDSTVQEIRQLFRTAPSGTMAMVWGHQRSSNRVVVVNLEKEEDYAITGVSLVDGLSRYN